MDFVEALEEIGEGGESCSQRLNFELLVILVVLHLRLTRVYISRYIVLKPFNAHTYIEECAMK